MSPIEFDELKDDGLDELLDKALENMHVNKNSEVSLEKSNVSLSETVAARFGLLESVKTAKFEDNYLFPDKIDNVLKSLLEVDGIDDKLEQTCDLNDVDDMIKQMLCELTSKELLYGPFKSLEEKFPNWFERNEKKLDKEELKKHKCQFNIIRDINQIFDSNNYSSNINHSGYRVFELMQNLMELGDLPEEFMSDLKDGIPNKNIDYAKNCIQM